MSHRISISAPEIAGSPPLSQQQQVPAVKMAAGTLRVNDDQIRKRGQRAKTIDSAFTQGNIQIIVRVAASVTTLPTSLLMMQRYIWPLRYALPSTLMLEVLAPVALESAQVTPPSLLYCHW